ncbi:signal transduction histidine kinase [Phyllobacterium sp. 1468]|uniref:sensor histidine kinase n=1 Tax=Phyllobacterium sp. 1468 TaxID=2817759 RepID=UPI00285881FA|nr:ATP-binding protein [Phyllobacterium sp. 1468]MDR6632638.1 signal transduction histidine kinase [Phyllobacterium sp. 1468]
MKSLQIGTDHPRGCLALHSVTKDELVMRLWKWQAGDRSATQEQNDVAMALTALSNAAAVFIIDTFTSIESAVAVFYVIVMLMASDFLTRRGIVAGGALCAALCVTSYFVSHGVDDDLATFLRLVGSLSALAITTALLFKNETSRLELLASHNQTRRSEYRYRSIFQQSRIALWEQDLTELKTLLDRLRADGVTDIAKYARNNPRFPAACTSAIRTVAVNEATLEILGNITHDQALGPIGRFIPHDCPALFGFVKAFFEGQRRYEAKGRIRDSHGNESVVLLAVEFPEDQTGLDRIVVGLVDLTQHEAAQATMMAAQTELARASRASTVGALSASIAHELNQPLGALLMNAEACLRWLRRDPPDLAAAGKAAERMMRDGQRASEIVKTTKAMLARTPVATEKIDLAPLVEETKALLEYELDRQSVSLEVRTGAKLPPVPAAKSELQQVLINLITNAMQAMQEARSPTREIAVKLASAGHSHVSISVSDTGPGISPDSLDKVFAPYFTTKPAGMGMGLAICKSTIEARGGKLSVRNNDGAGATFQIVLPVGIEVRPKRLYDVLQAGGPLH